MLTSLQVTYALQHTGQYVNSSEVLNSQLDLKPIGCFPKYEGKVLHTVGMLPVKAMCGVIQEGEVSVAVAG